MSKSMSMEEQFIEYCRTWLRTPWRHMQQSKGLGVDCWKLVEDCYSQFGLDFGYVKPYPRRIRFDLITDSFDPNPSLARVEGIIPGRLLVFRIGRHPHHLGIAVGHSRMIHANITIGWVVEEEIKQTWLDRLHVVYEYDKFATNEFNRLSGDDTTIIT